jgi:hypothetical protein
MTKFIFSISLIICGSSFGQTAKIVAKKPATLKDLGTNIIYVLDSSHTSITAYDSRGDSLWTSFTYECNKSVDEEDAGHPVKLIRQEILSMKFGDGEDIYNCNNCTGEKIIQVSYCDCVGYIRLKTGHFYVGDCD